MLNPHCLLCLVLYTFLCTKIKKFIIGNFFSLDGCSRPMWAVKGRRWPHSGKGEDFLTGQLIFFTETAVTLERKVEKSFPIWEINRHAEG